MSDRHESGPSGRERSVVFWDAGGLMVLARWGDEGALVIEGQDLSPPGEDGYSSEYEYGLVVPPGDIAKVLRGLDAPDDADPLAVLEQRGAELVRAGESRWLQRHGVNAEFWARYG